MYDDTERYTIFKLSWTVHVQIINIMQNGNNSTVHVYFTGFKYLVALLKWKQREDSVTFISQLI